jgi:hypothetical protein
MTTKTASQNIVKGIFHTRDDEKFTRKTKERINPTRYVD